MYKVFFNDRKIILTNHIELFKDNDKTEFTKYINALELQNSIVDFKQSEKPETLVIYSADIDDLWQQFKQQFYFIEASGGIVQHSNGKLLFINRRDKWDLPKGKLENNEDVETGALREVEEETGVKNLKIVKHIVNTWHCYEYKGQTALKVTHWFLMQTNSNELLVPQTTEDITQACWFDVSEITPLFPNMLPSIVDVYNCCLPLIKKPMQFIKR